MAEGKTLETWLDAHAKTCLGMFGMLESVTLLDLLAVDHLEIFGRERTATLNIDAQRFWFVALYLSALSSGVKLVRLLAHSPVPPTGEGFSVGQVSDKDATPSQEKTGLEKMKERNKRKKEQKAWLRKVNEEMGALGMKLLADVLDLIIPASIVGWVQVDPGLVGIAMFCSTIITGSNIWRHHGRGLAQKQD